MSVPLQTREIDSLVWLRQWARQSKSLQLTVFVIRSLQLVAQIYAFWVFSQLCARVVVEQQAIFMHQLVPLALACMAWGALAWIADRQTWLLKHQVEQRLEQRVIEQLDAQQLALTRRFSAAFWQQVLGSNLTDISDYISHYSVQKWLSASAPLVVIFVIMPINYLVALCLLLTLPIVPLFMVLVGHGAASLHRIHFIALERLGDMFSDRLKATTLITATNNHAEQQARLGDASDIANRKTMKVVSVAFLSSTVLDFFSTVAIALVAVFIGFSLLGEIQLGPKIELQAGLFMLLVSPLLFAEMRRLGHLYHQKAKAQAAAERYSQVLHDELSKQADKDFTGIDWLNYRTFNPALHAEKLSMQAGDWVRLLGNSGAGKSALLESLMGFKPASHHLDCQIALLAQRSLVLDNTLRQNLNLGHAKFTDAELWGVMDAVDLSHWARHLPHGLDTPLGDYPPLSGGEAHRLGVARVLLQKPDLVLLDEPSAHLTERQHRDLCYLIRSRLKNTTLIWASHKPLPDQWFARTWSIQGGEIMQQ